MRILPEVFRYMKKESFQRTGIPGLIGKQASRDRVLRESYYDTVEVSGGIKLLSGITAVIIRFSESPAVSMVSIIPLLISLFLLFGFSARVNAATWQCETALDMTAPKKTGDTFAGGWLLKSSECSETGVYYYRFEKMGGELTLALNLAGVKRGSRVEGEDFKIYVDGKGDESAFPPEVMALKKELSAGVEKWESRWRCRDRVAWAVIAVLMVISVVWITTLAKCVKRGRSGLHVNIQVFLASFLFIISFVELGFRGFDITYEDSGMMAFMDKVRDQVILNGGFRRLERTGPDAADASREINALGYRGEGHDTEKQPGTVRIVCAGDSFMFGIGVGSEWTFPAALKRELSEKPGAGQVEILNFGIPGSSASDVSSILLTEAAAAMPDIIIYGYVLNDIELGGFLDKRAYYDGIGIRPDSLQQILKRHDLGGLRRHMRIYHFLIGRLEDRLLNRLVLDMYSKSYEKEYNPDGLTELERDFSLISDYYSAKGIPVVLMIYPILVDLDGGYPFAASHDRVNGMARDAGMYGLDLLPFYSGISPGMLWVSRTDHHPNSEGHRIAAAAAADFIIKENLLKPARRDSGHSVGMQEEQKVLTADEAVSMAENALYGNDPDTALFFVAKAVETNPGDCGLQELAVDILRARGASRAVMQKTYRMKTISPACSSKAEAIEMQIRNQ